MTSAPATAANTWVRAGYRVIPEWSAYAMGTEGDVWSLSRTVPCGFGAVRRKSARRLTPDADGRVQLSQDGRKAKRHVHRELYPAVFPDLLRQRPQVWCRNGHLLTAPEHERVREWMPEPQVARWGTGNRICLRCCDPPTTFPCHTYSRAYGTNLPDYALSPAKPRPVLRYGNTLDELDDGYLVETFAQVN